MSRNIEAEMLGTGVSCHLKRGHLKRDPAGVERLRYTGLDLQLEAFVLPATRRDVRPDAPRDD
jgi:hypothetical protein